MQFIKLFLLIISVSSGLNLAIHTKREFKYDKIDFKCRKAISDNDQKNIECTDVNMGIDNDEKKMKNFCVTIETRKCQKYYNTKLNDIPECKYSDKYQLSELRFSLKAEYLAYKGHCSSDEQGNFCPLSSIEYSKRITETMTIEQQEENYDIALKDTCKSQKCIDNYLLTIDSSEKHYREKYEELSKLGVFSPEEIKQLKDSYETNIANIRKTPITNKTINYFKSDECVKSSNANKSTTYMSDASKSMTYTNILFITITLLLFTL